MDDPVTRDGSLIFFFQFLKAGGRWEALIKTSPLRYHSNRSSAIRDVLGTMMLSVLAGHGRYAHINSVRGDGVNPGLLGMSKTVSEDAVRRGLPSGKFLHLPDDLLGIWVQWHIYTLVSDVLLVLIKRLTGSEITSST